MARPRRRADWVFRSNAIQTAGGQDLLGTYEDQTTTVASGQADAGCYVLYDSFNHMSQSVRNVGNIGVFRGLARAARAEGRNPLILAVRGRHYVRPTTWALGTQYALGIRIFIADQDPITGACSQHPDYSMWTDNAAGDYKVADAANDRLLLREWRIWREFTTNDTGWLQLSLSWRGRRKLLPTQGLFLYVETDEVAVASVNTLHQLWYKSLVVDDQ